MNKKIKIIVSIVLAIGLITFFGYNYVMHGGARNLANEETDFTVSSASITTEFMDDLDAANKKYLENAVAIKGKITAINAKEIILDNTIICNFKNQDLSIKEGQIVTVKGRIIGYDDLMGEVKLDQCFIIKN
ncbi:OB-fold protein [Flavobacterium mesophilum]|uniref:OB-fold protein n=1 Tax=Flavobacterium mesophilum TaxID=3143495 RepID=UPI0031CEA54C